MKETTLAAYVVAILGSAGCALHGNPAMAGMFVVLLLLASALRQIGRRFDDIGERLDEAQSLLVTR